MSTPTPQPKRGGLAGLFTSGDILLTGALFGTVVLMIIPVPAALLDVLLAGSIGISLLILLTIIYVKDAPEFSSFPTILLGVTLFRLGLNIASTRLILLDGFAGHVIEAFGNFVVRGNFIVGAVVFLILVVINFVVITKGAGRIAEVAARFTLDAMPGKQMAIDAELNAGLIDEGTATKRRLKIQKEADFYGAMDGASKFVRGDAMAGIVITLINVVGGIIIGVLQMDLSLMESMQKFTLLSIGDGLVSQIPALIVSLAAGVLVTRTSDVDDLGSHITQQLTAYPRAILVLSGMLGIFAVVPGMPMVPFLVTSVATGYLGWTLRKKQAARVAAAAAETGTPAKAEGTARAGATPAGAQQAGAAPAPAPSAVGAEFEKIIESEPFAIELGYNVVALADRAQNGDLLDRITGVRKTIARELGLVVPPIAVRDNLELDTNEYRFLLRGKEIGRSRLMPKRWLAMNVAGSKVQLRGIPTIEPVFGIDAVWIGEEERKSAEINGYSVVDASSVLVTHLSEAIRQHAHHLLTRQDVQALVDVVKQKHPTLVAELLPDLVNIGVIQRVIQNLLRENVSVRNLPLVLEAVADYAHVSKNPDDLSEQVRRRMGEFFVSELESSPGVLEAVTLDPRIEQHLLSRVQRTPYDITLTLDPQLAQHMLNDLNARVADMTAKGMQPILVTTTEIRLAFKRFFEPSLPKLVVLSYQELPAQIEIRTFGIVSMPPGGLRGAPMPAAPVAVPAAA
jgi:flagellar biosynthesis protein FlhA